MFSKEAEELAEEVYQAIPVIAEKCGRKWHWEPKVGERVTHVVGTSGTTFDGQYLIVEGGLFEFTFWVPIIKSKLRAKSRGSIPLLPWETLVKILEDLGYEMTVTYDSGELSAERAYCSIWREGKWRVENKQDEECQVVVMLAVLELLKEETDVKK